MIRFSHLHSHTDASLKDGLRPVSEMVKAVAAKGFSFQAITDHGSLANAISFTLECQANGVKPIIGIEGYVAFDGEIGHLTLLADGNDGFNNLVRLNNIAHASEYKHPAFTVDQLVRHAEGLVLLTGCVASPFNRLSLHDAVKLGARLKMVFGPRMFAESMFVADTDTHTRPMELAEKLGLKLLITNDSHFPNAEDAPIHPILTQMKAGYDYNSANLWLKTGEEILHSAKRFISEDTAIEWMDRSYRVSEKIQSVNFKKDPHLPDFPGAKENLRKIVIHGAESRGPEYVKRAEYELSIIEKMGYSTYFMVLDDIVGHARAHGVRVGPGRGSGAGSLVLFMLGITHIDPLKYDLPFERFLNPERIGMPDVDTDFDSEHRQVVIDYAKKRWNATPIATYSRYSHKSLVHDLSKQYRVPRELDAKAADEGPESVAFKEICDHYGDFGKAYNTIYGQIKHKGTHAGGVIVTDSIVPIERTGDDLAAAWVEGLHNELSYAGIVKFDLLGLSALSILQRLEKKFATTAPEPEDGSKVFEIFRKGRLEGIFQFSGSSGIRDLTLKLQPDKFEDLVAINALYRPGALDVGSTGKYPEWKKHPRKVSPVITDILASTYGAIVYQEQVMAIFARMTGGTLGAADEARRVIVKSKEHDAEWVEKFMKLRLQFVEGCLRHDMDEEESNELWNEIAAHSRYSFNRAHSVSYAHVAWQMAWWKTYHLADFYAALLNVDQAEAQTYLVAAIEEGVKLSMPDLNNSGYEYSATEKEIFMPLTAIKYLSVKAAQSIIEARKKGPFASGEDFMKRIEKRIVRAQAREGLYMLNAFGDLTVSPRDLALKLDGSTWPEINSENQRKYLGVVIPGAEALARIKHARELGYVAGIISSIEDKKSKWGPYHVIRLVPNGVFWTRGLTIMSELKVGDCVMAEVKAESGKANKIKYIK